MKVTHGTLSKRYNGWNADRYVMGIDWAAQKFPDAFFQPASPIFFAPAQITIQQRQLLAQYWS